MATINQLNSLDTSGVSGSDQLAVYSVSNGDARKLSLTNLLAWFSKAFTSPTFQQQFITPGTGFSVQIVDNAANTWVLIQPASGLATGALTLPLSSSCADGQEIMVSTTQQISSFSVDGNGAIGVYGVPPALGADDSFRLRFFSNTSSWYAVG